jgi:hypothetical protein
MSYDAIGMDIAFLFVFIFVMIVITVPRKGDTPATQTMRKLSRMLFTATLLMVIGMAALALYMAKVHQ